jgi:hypothetical protein
MKIGPIVVVLVVGLMIGLQLLVRSKARAMRGKDVPEVPGTLGRQLTGAPRALRQTNPAVHLVDVSQDRGVARSFQVMGTPSVVEIANGKIVGCYVGAVPAAVVARFS